MNKQIISEAEYKDGVKSDSLLKVEKSFYEVLEVFDNIFQLFNNPEFILQSIGEVRRSISNEDYKKAISSLITCRDNLKNILVSFRAQVVSSNTELLYSSGFANALTKYYIRAREDMSTIALRELYPIEIKLLNEMRNTYFETVCLMKEFNSLIMIYNDSHKENKIPLIDTSLLS